jgi:hypothetical protein
LDEQLEHAPGEEEQDEQADALPDPSVPDHENVLMSRVAPGSPQAGHATGSSRFPRTISSKRSPQELHLNS